MDKHLMLLAALRARAERSGPTVDAEEVRAVGRAIGVSGVELISILEMLAEQGAVAMQWGGQVRVLESEGRMSSPSGEICRTELLRDISRTSHLQRRGGSKDRRPRERAWRRLQAGF